MIPTIIKQRFFAKVKKTNSCWLWTASNNKGYGLLGFKGKNIRAHRLSWLIHRKKPIGKFYVLHKCHNPPCVNPKHLYLGTHRQNMLDSVENGKTTAAKNAAKTHCPKGHPYSGKNLIYRSNKRWRDCRECHRLRLSAWRGLGK